jgi:hypothetical protein
VIPTDLKIMFCSVSFEKAPFDTYTYICMYICVVYIFLIIGYTRGGINVCLWFFLRKCNCNNNEIYVDDSNICNYGAVFPQNLLHFHHSFASIDLDAVYQCCKIPCFDFGAHHKWYKETLIKLR